MVPARRGCSAHSTKRSSMAGKDLWHKTDIVEDRSSLATPLTGSQFLRFFPLRSSRRESLCSVSNIDRRTQTVYFTRNAKNHARNVSVFY
ncbi:hypothetical protein DPMN_138537 [Dreissena polymorpha]|uniref:Uncharacterized protein n=1 Tax=Dreissena polymorpha TaxID=45954 RepID=A0A9D4G4F2_DREPO|nr:hypothetical protein DPMN_138537 [Dreissena polymorpha]